MPDYEKHPHPDTGGRALLPAQTMNRPPHYLHNETQAFIPVDSKGQVYPIDLKFRHSEMVELVYNGQMDVIWHPTANTTLHRRSLLRAFRMWQREGKEPAFQIAPTFGQAGVFLNIALCRPMLAICADMRRHVPRARRW